MANSILEPYKNAAAAILYLFGGTIVTIVTYYIIPSILGVFTDMNTDGVQICNTIDGATVCSTVQEPSGVYTLIMFILWGAIMIALPVYKGVNAIQTIGTDSKNRIIGALWLTFALILTYFAWYMIPAIANMMPDSTLTLMFWIGFILTWTTTAIALPITAMIKANG